MNRKDLVVLAADKDMEHALKGLLARPIALGIRAIEVEIIVHPEHDSACASRGVEYLSNFSGRFRYGLLVFDHEGSGKEDLLPNKLQETLNNDFAQSSWGNRAKTVLCRRSLKPGYGVILPMLTWLLAGRTASHRSVAGW